MYFKVSAETLQATLNYLTGRPYGEVYQLINALYNSEKVEELDSQDKSAE